VGWRILGLETAFKNLRDAVTRMEDIEATWLAIDTMPEDFISRIPLIANNHSLKIGLIARSKIGALEKSGKVFDAAYFNHILPALFVRGFRQRVPCFDSLDVTPLSLAREGQAYYSKPRKRGNRLTRELRRRYARSVYCQAAYLLPWSDYTKRSLLDDYQIPEKKIRTWFPGTSLRIWQGRSAENTPSTKEQLDVLFVGGDFKRKGGDLLLRIARREEFRNCRFHFVTRNFMGQCLANTFVHTNVQANSEELIRLYRQADIFVLPTRADFAPTNSICEAMAMGLPVVATRVGGLEEIVVDGHTGFVVPVDHIDLLGERIRTLAGNVHLRKQLGENARRLVEMKYDSEKNAKIIVDLMKAAAKRQV